MKIFHVAHFSPNGCGIYEAARDMAIADSIAGHQVYFVDSGYSENGKLVYVEDGTVDNRCGFKIVTSNPIHLDNADIVIIHNMPSFSWFVKHQAPVIYIVHDRPLASFRLEHDTAVDSYSFINNVSKWPRVKKMVYFWPEFKPFWHIIQENKQVVLNYPVIDQNRFNIHGQPHIIEDKHKGEFNILICDSWRNDIDIFEIVFGIMQTSKELNNVKFHIYSIDLPLKPCWELLINKLRNLNIVGELHGRMREMEQIYRSMDAVLTPHRIVTRVIGEALSCGTPVIASEGCSVAQFHCDPHDPYSIAEAIQSFVNSNQKENKENALLESKKFHLSNYSKVMNPIYEEIIKGK